MKLKWYGHSCFALTLASGENIILDPFDDTVGYPLPRVHAHIATVSHAHFDHACLDALLGYDHAVRTPGTHEFDGIRIIAIPCAHDDAGGKKRGSNLIMRIEAEGRVVCHLGDLGHEPTPEQYAAIAGADAILIPVGGFYTIDTPLALKIIACAKPKLVIPMHYKTPAIGFPITDETAFAKALHAEYVDSNEIELTPDRTGAVVLRYE